MVCCRSERAQPRHAAYLLHHDEDDGGLGAQAGIVCGPALEQAAHALCFDDVPGAVQGAAVAVAACVAAARQQTLAAGPQLEGPQRLPASKLCKRSSGGSRAAGLGHAAARGAPTNMLVLMTSTGPVAVVVITPVIMLAPRWVVKSSPAPVRYIHSFLDSS